MTFEQRTQRARLIGQMLGKIDYLQDKEKREEIAGTGAFADVDSSMLRQVLADLRKDAEQLRAIVIEG